MKNRKIFELDLGESVFTCYLDQKARKNLNITIKPNNELWVSKPKALSLDDLSKYLIMNKDWILERSSRINDVHIKRNSYIKEDYVEIFGKVVYYKDYPDVLDNLKDILRNYIKVNRYHFDEVFGKQPSIEVVSLKGRWGACSPSLQNILISDKLVHYPVNCVNYVLIHEYLHLIVPDHSSKFHELLEEIMPDYQVYVDYLKEN